MPDKAKLIEPLVLSSDVESIITNMKTYGVFCDMVGHRLDDCRPAAMVSCADGWYADDLRVRHMSLKMNSGLCSQPLLHNLAWNGGALTLVEGSPINSLPLEDQIFFNQVQKTHGLGYTAIPLYAHVPCKAANGCNMGFWQLMQTLMAAKARVKTIGPDVVASAFLHIDHPGNSLEAAWVNREAWQDWVAERVRMDEHIKIAA